MFKHIQNLLFVCHHQKGEIVVYNSVVYTIIWFLFDDNNQIYFIIECVCKCTDLLHNKLYRNLNNHTVFYLNKNILFQYQKVHLFTPLFDILHFIHTTLSLTLYNCTYKHFHTLTFFFYCLLSSIFCLHSLQSNPVFIPVTRRTHSRLQQK